MFLFLGLCEVQIFFFSVLKKMVEICEEERVWRADQ